MRRITVHSDADTTTLQFEGKLAGPWVREGETCWRQTVAQHGPSLRFDLTGVILIDHADRDKFCDGCSFFADQISHLAHLHARDTSLVMVARAPFAKIKAFKKRMGWTVPWYSSLGSDFNDDFGVTTDQGETNGLSGWRGAWSCSPKRRTSRIDATL